MNTVDICNKKMVHEKGGGTIVNYDYIVTDDLGKKKSGSGSFAVSSTKAIPAAIRANVEYKLGYKSFTLNDEPVSGTLPRMPSKMSARI